MRTIQKYVEEATFVSDGQDEFIATINHDLNTIDVIVQVYNSENLQEYDVIEIVNANTIKICKKNSEKVKVVIIG